MVCPAQDCSKTFARLGKLSGHFAIEHSNLFPSDEVLKLCFSINLWGDSCDYCGTVFAAPISYRPSMMRFHLIFAHSDMITQLGYTGM